MTKDNLQERPESEESRIAANSNAELPDSWWYKIYLLVIITTVIVIGAMVWFTNYFSN